MKLSEPIKGIIGFATAWSLWILFLSACSCEKYLSDTTQYATKELVDSTRSDIFKLATQVNEIAKIQNKEVSAIKIIQDNFENEKALSDDNQTNNEIRLGKIETFLQAFKGDSLTNKRLDKLENDYPLIRKEISLQCSLLCSNFEKELKSIQAKQDSLIEVRFTDQEKKFLAFVDSVKNIVDTTGHSIPKADSVPTIELRILELDSTRRVNVTWGSDNYPPEDSTVLYVDQLRLIHEKTSYLQRWEDLPQTNIFDMPEYEDDVFYQFWAINWRNGLRSDTAKSKLVY